MAFIRRVACAFRADYRNKTLATREALIEAAKPYETDEYDVSDIVWWLRDAGLIWQDERRRYHII